MRDIAFDDDNIGHSSRNAGGNAVGDDVPLDTEASSTDEDDVVEAIIPCRQSGCPVPVPQESPSEVDVQVTHGNGNHTQNQEEVPKEDAPDPTMLMNHQSVIVLLMKVLPPQFKQILSFPLMVRILNFLLAL